MATKQKKTGKKAPRVKAPRVKMRIEAMLDVKHQFNQDEKVTLGEKLTAHMTSRQEIEDAMKANAAEYKSRIKTFDTEIASLHGKLRDGHEFRATPVIVHFNKGTKNGKCVAMKGTKRIVRKDNGEHIRDEPMTACDLQDELFAVEKAKREEKKAEEKPAGELPLNSPQVPEKPGDAASTAATA